MPSINQWGRENPDRVDVPDDSVRVDPKDATEHGYWGVAINEDRHSHTVAGVTAGGTSPKASEAKTEPTPKHEAPAAGKEGSA